MTTKSIRKTARKSSSLKEKAGQRIKMTRFDGRIPEEQKNLFLKAATLTGKTTTDFVFQAAIEKATQIILEREQTLASVRDRELFFDALLNPAKPNSALKKAAVKFKKQA